MHITFRNRLSFRQAKNTVIVVLLLGLILSAVQIFLDLRKEKKYIDTTISQFLATVQESAAQATYTLNEVLARKVVEGLFKYRPIQKAQVVDDFGSVLAHKERPATMGPLNRLVISLFGRDLRYSLPLFSPKGGKPVGCIDVSVDGYLIALNFINRAGITIITIGILTVILGVLLTLMFYVSITRPLLKIAKSLSLTETAKPPGQRLQTQRGHENDEIGLLVGAINTAEEGLRESEEKYRNLFENLYDVYYRTDDKGIITLLSPSIETYFGYTPDELIGQNMNDFYVNPQRREAFISLLIKDGYVENFEAQFKRKDNSAIWMSTNAKSIKDEKGIFRGVEGITRDVSERMRMEDEKEKVEAQLRQAQKMESIGTLAGGIAHDFNNVLYSIIGYTELTMDDIPEGSLAHKNLKEVLKGTMRAKDMVKQILTFSRKADTEKKPIKIQSIVKEALNLLRTSIPSTIDIRQNIDGDYSPVLADSTQIHQVVMNLATNAYQAMREKGGLLELTLMEKEVGSDDSALNLYPGPYLKLTVSDTGHGMDNVVMGKIFEPYFSTKGPGEGTGMGLSVVHGIIKDHGGDIEVYSKLGEGTTFSVYLPLVETRPVEPKAVSVKPLPTGTERILFVDDEETIVLMTQQLLERLGYRVTPRTSSVEAFEAFRAQPDTFDLVITDFTMPNMTGIELASKLLNIRPDIPIIICTGFSEVIDKKRAEAIGIREYAMKPIAKEEIARTIRKVLDEEKEL